MKSLIQNAVDPVIDSWETAHDLPRIGDPHSPPLRTPKHPSEQPLKLAAVLVPIVADETGEESSLSVLLTQRTAHLRAHAGQISFPGGRAETHDSNPIATALRETEEEIGIPSDCVQILGSLNACQTGSGFLVVPVVGLVQRTRSLQLDAFEVAEVFEVPLEFVLDARNRDIRSHHVNGADRHYFVYEYGERYIWGATARMLVDLERRVND